MKPNPVVLVPGIMGSELGLNGSAVWNDSWSALWAVFNPTLLAHWVPLQPGEPLKGVYGDTIEWMRVQKGYGPDDLYAFGYDWRLGIRSAAEGLAHFVENTVRRGSQIIFLAHSLGCLVVRWALAEGLITSIKVKIVVAAGPPFLGSATAFKSVIDIPDIDERLNYLFRTLVAVYPTLANRATLTLIKSMMTIQSLIEMMPHPQIPVFSDGSAQLFGVSAWPGWPDVLKLAVSNAEHVQNRLESTSWPVHVPRKLILSDEWPTETGFFIDNSDPYKITASLPSQPGDGTVLADSARAFGSDEAELVVQSAHRELLRDQQVRNYLNSILY